MSYKIEKGIPVTQTRRGGRKGFWRDLFQSMEVGDSFKCPCSRQSIISKRHREVGIKITTQVLDEFDPVSKLRFMRVWRIA